MLVVLASWTPELSATLILAYRGGGEVIIAADSVRTVATTPPVRIAACKILNFGDVVFTGAGDTTLPGDGFSIESITASLHERERVGAKTLRERIAKFDQEAIAAFERLHEQRRTTRPVTFTYIVGFVREGQPVIYSRRLASANGVAEIGEWEILPDGEVLVAGQPEVLDHLSGARSPDRPGPVALLEAVIEHQARRTPSKVGGPVDIIRLTTKGVEWQQRKLGCRESE